MQRKAEIQAAILVEVQAEMQHMEEEHTAEMQHLKEEHMAEMQRKDEMQAKEMQHMEKRTCGGDAVQ